MDYANLRRVKIWGRARAVEGESALVATLLPTGYKARAEQAILLTVTARDANCPQHIPRLLSAADAKRVDREGSQNSGAGDGSQTFARSDALVPRRMSFDISCKDFNAQQP
jgi:hypothetical protein